MILDDICALSRKRAAEIPADIIKSSQEEKYSAKNLCDAVRNCKGIKNAVIAEIKYRTPSDDSLGSAKTPAEIAAAYEKGGACAVSVLTEPFFFKGGNENIALVKSKTGLPVLRKDFIVDEKQIYEAYSLKADSVLLISGVLKNKLADFIEVCKTLSVEPLVETRTTDEAEFALRCGAELCGINNRNLKDMTVDTDATKKISETLQNAGVTVISESGIKTPADIGELKSFCDGFLIGTALMKSKDPQKTLEGVVFA
ncbi:indole-3-glycerol phosphate synthase [Methanomicrobium sp. W14]|uniref:indole-3-glycerol phosphate synthase TrpC n=1 Tax=Methanomicrobium sp. W14 TaxID=2817839 RepID=UPI001AEB5C49|nr:indole-3-glycerol-phosphate synthase [Methanomicrobium sp. W14]MBP2132425.1 indole-3-glycerol phosphate synthase [Methanomicrobium sp. W14]